MYSLNVPVPGRLKQRAATLHPRLVGFGRVRERHSLVLKRCESGEPNHLFERVRRTLAGAPAFEARAASIDFFENPVRGPGPVVYVAIESPGLLAVHERLTDEFDAIPGLEGPDYVPHVTLARGGSLEQARALAAVEFDPIEWTVTELVFWNARYGEAIGSVSLPHRSP